jgi:hypothetical protein
MLKQQKTRIIRTQHRDVLTGVDIRQEGVALVFVNNNGLAQVKPAAGVANERFAGVSWSQTQVPDYLTKVEQVQVSGNLTFTLSRNNLVSGQVRIERNSDGSALTLAAAPAAGKFAADYTNGIISIDVTDAGTAAVPVLLNVFYKYQPTAMEAIMAQGSGPIGGITAASAMGTVGVIVEGDVSTDMFDVTDDWSVATKIYLGPAGIFTMKAVGTELRGANLIEAPGVGNAFLTLNLGPYSG